MYHNRNTLEIKVSNKGDKSFMQKKASNLAFFRHNCTETKRDLRAPCNILLWHTFLEATRLFIKSYYIERVISPNCIKFTLSSAIPGYMGDGTHTDFISPCNKQTIQSDPNFVKDKLVIMPSTFKHN